MLPYRAGRARDKDARRYSLQGARVTQRTREREDAWDGARVTARRRCAAGAGWSCTGDTRARVSLPSSAHELDLQSAATHLSHAVMLCLCMRIWPSAKAPRRSFISWRLVARNVACSAMTSSLKADDVSCAWRTASWSCGRLRAVSSATKRPEGAPPKQALSNRGAKDVPP